MSVHFYCSYSYMHIELFVSFVELFLALTCTIVKTVIDVDNFCLLPTLKISYNLYFAYTPLPSHTFTPMIIS